MQGAFFTSAYLFSFLLRFDFIVPEQYWAICMLFLPLNVAVKFVSFYYFKMHMGLWRYFSFRDLNRLVKATICSAVLFMGLVLVFWGHGFPRSIFLLDGVLTLMFLGGFRVLVRIFREGVLQDRIGTGKINRILIVGAGDAGDMAARMIEQEMKGSRVVGFLDDSAGKRGLTIRGYPIFGSTDDAYLVAKEQEVTQVLFAIRGVSKELVRHVVECCSTLRLQYTILPVFRDVITGELEVDRIRSMQVTDLLGRDPIELDKRVVSQQLRDQCVLVSGAGGSIGSELARQVSRFGPSRLLLVDIAETPLFEIDRELQAVAARKMEVIPILLSIADRGGVERVLKQYQPSIIYHAAAYKHVPMLETNSLRGIENNIFGTQCLAETAQKYGVKRFVMVSTDKAVRPTNVMGATKRCTEMLITLMNNGVTRCSAVRFGNVLGSSGSVVPVFRQQIEAGGPITVTHPEMTRYFMTIPEAVELVLQAGAMGSGGETFILDMGKPVKIVDLARRMIELSGKIEDVDIAITFTGIRPGEKMYEELVAYGEETDPTAIDKINVHKRADHVEFTWFTEKLRELKELTETGDSVGAVNLLWEIVAYHDHDVTR
jgi:FlaA1/EpsC-like NDP-sugar epimerase